LLQLVDESILGFQACLRWRGGTGIFAFPGADQAGCSTRLGAGKLALFTIGAPRQLLERLLASAALLDVD
jgi:hypothetical protein